MGKKDRRIRLGIPGTIPGAKAADIFRQAGYDMEIDEESKAVSLNDHEIECFFARAKEITRLVKQGLLDGGIVSRTALAESSIQVPEICDFGPLTSLFDETKVVLAVPEKSRIKSIWDLEGKKIVTRVPNITKAFLKKHKVSATIEFFDETNEAKVPLFGDALVEFSTTGTTLKLFKLRILAVLMKDSLILVACKKSLQNAWKKRKIENVAMLLKGAQRAQRYSGIMLHAPAKNLEKILGILPSLKKPTITPLREKFWFDVFTVAPKNELRQLFPALKKMGCTDIAEFSLSKVVL